MTPSVSLSNAAYVHSAASSAAKPQSSSNLDFFRQVTFDATSKACVTAGLGYALLVADCSFGWTFFGHAAGTLITRVVINVTKEYNQAPSESLDELSQKTLELLHDYPFLKMISFLFGILIAPLSLKLGFAVGMFVGGVTALTIDYEQSVKRLQVNEAEERGSGISDVINQWV